MKIKVNLQKRRPHVEEINETCCGPKSFEIITTWKNGIHRTKRFSSFLFFFFRDRRHQLSINQNMGHYTDKHFSYEKQGKRMTLKNPQNGEIFKINRFSDKRF